MMAYAKKKLKGTGAELAVGQTGMSSGSTPRPAFMHSDKPPDFW
jgi:hypothetical protein